MKNLKSKNHSSAIGNLILPAIIFSFCLFSFGFYGCKKNDVNPANPVTQPADTTTPAEHKIVVLMYHDISVSAPANIYQRSISDFIADLNYIKSKNYTVISFDDLLSIRDNTMPLNSDAVIISFDDGYLSNYTIAYPLLKSYNYAATLFVVTEWVNQTDRVTVSNIMEMDQYRNTDGNRLISIDSHTSSHPFLKTDEGTFASPAAYQASLNAELGDSKNWIQTVTGQPTMWLALPYGDGANDSLIIQTAKNYGYSGIRTSVYGSFQISSMNLFVLPSLPILSTTNISDVKNYLN